MLTPEICEAILRDHYRKPRHTGVCEGSLVRTADNPACGDMVRVSLKKEVTGEGIECVRFEGAGCAASQAGASLILGLVHGLPALEALRRIEDFCTVMKRGDADPAAHFAEFGEAAALLVFATIPARLTCATLAARLLAEMLR